MSNIHSNGSVEERRKKESLKRQEELNSEIQKILEIKDKYNKLISNAQNEMFLDTESEELEALEELSGTLNNLKEYVAHTLEKLANVVKPVNQIEKKMQEAVKKIDVTINNDDLKNPNILNDYTNFLTSQKTIPKKDALNQAEITYLVAKEVAGISPQAQKLALVSKMANSIIIHKNIQNIDTAQLYYFNIENAPSSVLYNELIQKHKDYRKTKWDNLETVCNYYNIPFHTDNPKDLELISLIEKEFAIVNFAQYCSHFKKKIELDEDTLSIISSYKNINFKTEGEHEAFYKFGNELLENNFKDNMGILKSNIDKSGVDSFLTPKG